MEAEKRRHLLTQATTLSQPLWAPLPGNSALVKVALRRSGEMDL